MTRLIENRQAGASRKMLAGTLLLMFCGLTVLASPVQQDQEEDSQRRLWNMQFRNARAGDKKNATSPSAAGTKGSSAGKTASGTGGSNDPKSGKPDANGSATEAAVEGELIGVTFYRLRKPTMSEQQDKSRLLRQKDTPDEYVPERVRGEASFSRQDKVRLGFEIPRVKDGYLYIIDREVYADGNLSKPYLIFPLTTTRGGDNVVKAGKIIEIPARNDKSPYFDLSEPGLKENRVGERLTIIVTPEPLRVPSGDKLVELDESQVEQWEKDWGGAVEKREAKKAAGGAWTAVEIESGEGTRLLRQNDPLPQTIYHVRVRPGKPALFHLMLRIAP